MASSQAKIGWKRMRKRENKIVIPFRSVLNQRVIENSKKIAKKFKKSKNTITASFHGKTGRKKRRMEKIKIIATFCSFRTGKRKFQKKLQKN